ncbi:hypothetical protein LTR56_007552 [Elasticomyces elasticus]|nr:hypothetical protein LTR56_007552 [Elasticomyces elasticus]KAK3668126.1 hypothetical protein LTR22_000811 [Elasticomyces elasticus]KAK5769547.1 hypothetical protein LTS12_000474 [Elasticomyces elasticus]
MSQEIREQQPDGDHKLSAGQNVGYLPSPALSPIYESDTTGLENGYGHGGLDEQLNRAANRPVHKEQTNEPLDTSVLSLADGVVAPVTPRLPDGDVAKALKLSPEKLSPEKLSPEKLSPEKLHDLVTSPDSLPIRASTTLLEDTLLSSSSPPAVNGPTTALDHSNAGVSGSHDQDVPSLASISATPGAIAAVRPSKASRSISTPVFHRKQSSSKSHKSKPDLPAIKTEDTNVLPARSAAKLSPKHSGPFSPHATIMPIPPLSLPTYLQLELSSERPSELYIHRGAGADSVYESSRVKFERLMNFLLLPPSLEQVLWFGAIACLDAWLYTFTILPLRFLKAIAVLVRWWLRSAQHEVYSLWSFVFDGVGRVWHRRRQYSMSASRRSSVIDEAELTDPSAVHPSPRMAPTSNGNLAPAKDTKTPSMRSPAFRHRRTRSTPSALLPDHKADILQGLLIFVSCYVLMWFDASRMYHSIRGQSAIKLYVIYNVLEVFDRLFSALGQDILECLFSKETLERNDKGRSKLMRPFWLWVLALVYVVVHSTALFYQVVTLNVAVNSYSNALLTLLMSNQFVEIKGTVFKKFEKENLFQITCADVVERFQLWLMLLIIAVRNIVEVGGLSISLTSVLGGTSTPTESFAANATGLPLVTSFIIPRAFTLLPKWTGEVLGPFLIVLGSEALVDWCKHAYIGKFNNVKPAIYDRFLDVLAKDYYSHAFVDQNLTKRLGLPVIPLSCLFIRACMQTYHMFLAAHLPPPMPSLATTVSLDTNATTTSPATTAALQHIDQVFRRALGRSTFGAGSEASGAFSWWSLDDLIAFGTMITVFLALFLILLAFKLLLGMLLLTYSRNRCSGMEERERQITVALDGKRAGIGALTEVDEAKRKWIYEDDLDGLRSLREKEERGRKQTREKADKLEGVDRYMMAAKRIW